MRSILLSALLLVVSVARDSSAGINLASYDLVVTNNLSTTSEVEGRTIVGGTLSGSSTQYGFMLGSNTNTSLLANNITDTGTVTASTGNLVYGTNSSATLQASNGSVIQSASLVASTLAGLTTQLENTSGAYSALTANSSYTLSGNSLTFTVNNANLPTTGATAGVAVFSIDESVFNNNNNLSIDLSKGNATTIIINVTGSGPVSLYSSDNFQSGFQNNDANILFNFQNETAVGFSNSEYGSILAPNATLTDSGGALNGSIYVENFTQTNEVHLPSFTGYIPVTVPEPASVVTTSLGLAIMAGLVRRKNRSKSDCRR